MNILHQPYRWILHGLFWAFYLVVQALMLGQLSTAAESIIRITIAFSLHLILAYSNWFVLIPDYFKQQRYGLYFTWILGMIIGFTLGRVLIEEYYLGILPQVKAYPIIRYVLTFFSLVMVWISSSLLKLLEDFIQTTAREAALKTGKLEAELKLLKSQINPHFLFNTLNNVYSLVYLKSDDAAPMLLKLSGILRYMLYECEAPQVPIQKEINYLKDCIELQVLDPKDRHKVQFEVVNHHPETSIEPLLFINFIENSFKHSSLSMLHGFIRIRLQIEAQQVLFSTENSIMPEYSPKDKVGGIGIQNVKQRLNLLYSERYTLDIRNDGKVFGVYLTLQRYPDPLLK